MRSNNNQLNTTSTMQNMTRTLSRERKIRGDIHSLYESSIMALQEIEREMGGRERVGGGGERESSSSKT